MLLGLLEEFQHGAPERFRRQHRLFLLHCLHGSCGQLHGSLGVEIPIGDKQRFGSGVEKRAGKAGQRFGARLIPISGVAG